MTGTAQNTPAFYIFSRIKALGPFENNYEIVTEEEQASIICVGENSNSLGVTYGWGDWDDRTQEQADAIAKAIADHLVFVWNSHHDLVARCKRLESEKAVALAGLKNMLSVFDEYADDFEPGNEGELLVKEARGTLASTTPNPLYVAAPERLHALQACIDQMEQCESMFRDDEEFVLALNNARRAATGKEG